LPYQTDETFMVNVGGLAEWLKAAVLKTVPGATAAAASKPELG
jgi:hypothetical protein